MEFSLHTHPVFFLILSPPMLMHQGHRNSLHGPCQAISRLSEFTGACHRREDMDESTADVR
ncbi:hypothetical protein LINPERPRIM_LOCUS14184, partial [Linum perenne]